MRTLVITIPVLAGLVAMLNSACASRVASGPSQAGQSSSVGVATTSQGSVESRIPVATSGAYATNKYRNLFTELGKAPGEVDAKLRQAYDQLFHGDPNGEAVMYPAGRNDDGPKAYIMDTGNGDVRSEGMSYGMMIALQYDRKDDFDALWNWAKSHMYHSQESHPAFGYFSWQMRPDGTAIDEMPAADGEEYFAMSLLFAAHRWGSGKGLFNYKQQALTILDNMRNRQEITGMANGKRDVTAVALFNSEHKMVRFTPDTGNFAKNGDHSDPSYHLPAFYELWALWGPESDRSFWSEAAKASREFFVKAAHPATGLTPDYANFDGTPKAASWDAGTANFRYDAFRTAMNWSVDAAWWAKDTREIELSDRLLAFFEAQGPAYPCNFTLDGKATNRDQTLGLVSMNAAAALAASHPRAWKFVEAIYQRSPPTGKWRYYDGMLYMLSMLHLSGNFRIYLPPGSAATN